MSTRGFFFQLGDMWPEMKKALTVVVTRSLMIFQYQRFEERGYKAINSRGLPTRQGPNLRKDLDILHRCSQVGCSFNIQNRARKVWQISKWGGDLLLIYWKLKWLKKASARKPKSNLSSIWHKQTGGKRKCFGRWAPSKPHELATANSSLVEKEAENVSKGGRIVQ